MAGEAFFFDFFLGAIDGGLLPARAIMRVRLHSARSELPHNDVRPRPHGGIFVQWGDFLGEDRVQRSA